jgi:AraC-like DNA-binding protein
MLAAWGAQALYLGPSFGLTPHRNAVAVLAFALDDALHLAVDARQPAGGTVRCRSALIEPASLHALHAAGDCAFLYLDAASPAWRTWRARCRHAMAGAGLELDDEAHWLDALAQLRRQPGTAAAQAVLARARGRAAGQASRIDARLAPLLDALLQAPGGESGIAPWAARAGLSVSRFQHLFKAQTEVPFRRFRLWARMRQVVQAVAAGHSMTQAALDAGFASSAHLSTAFRDMFGLSLSQLIGSRPQLILIDGASVQAA